MDEIFYEGWDAIERAWREGLTPDPLLTVSEWADKHRVLSSKAASEPGRWRTSRTPYLREIMDCLCPMSPIERVVFMKGAQVGGTELGLNWVGYVIHHAPGPMMAVWPTVEMAKRASKQRIDALIEESPASTVRQVLTNEKYIGNNVYNRHSFKLKKKHVDNPPEMWIRKEGAFEGIVPLDTFLAAQEVLTERSKKLTDEELLHHLKALYAECGRLSGFIIDQVANGPSASLYTSRFGSLTRAYELIGYRPPGGTEHLEINRRLRQLHPEIIARTEHTIAELGGHIRRDPKTDLLTLNDELVISLVLARCQTTPTGHLRWRIRFDPARLFDTAHPDITVAIRLDAANTQELDYYLLPRLDLPEQEIRVSNKNSTDFECFRFDDLNFFYGMSERERLQRRV